MFATMREVDDAEIEHVSGGACTCGAGANCITTETYKSNGLEFSYNCSGDLVSLPLLRRGR